MTNRFLEALAQTPPASTQFDEVLNVLDEFAQAVDTFTKGKVHVTREPGFLVSVGQEYRILLQSASGGPVQPMFRVYVPLQGYPVNLDLHQDRLLPCEDRPALEIALEEFLKDPHVQAQIEYFRSR
jgi:hypothetical protein